jgi:hypothetical protein
MQIAVLIEALADGRFRARPHAPLKAVGEGNSADEALADFRRKMEMELSNGKELVMIELDIPEFIA